MAKDVTNTFKQVATLDYATFYLNASGDTLMSKYRESTVLDIEMAKEVLNTMEPFINGGAVYRITDTTAKFLDFKPEARRYFKDNISPEKIKLHAILAVELPAKIVANFYARFHKPNITTRVFSKLEEALKWIEYAKS